MSRLSHILSCFEPFSASTKRLPAMFANGMPRNSAMVSCKRCTRLQRDGGSTTIREYSTQRNAETNSSKRINIAPRGILVTLIFGVGSYLTYQWLEQQKQLATARERLESLLEAGLGQLNWELTDQHGEQRRYSDFRGKWIMIYFGFCHCPDICPEELEKLISVVEGIDKTKGVPNVQPIFVTLDPERDTSSFMKKYCQDFSDKLIGLTGSVDEIAAAAQSYRVYYGYGEKDEDGDYIVDHTICMYLVNPEGYLVDVYERRATVPGIISGSIKRMRENAALNLQPLPQQTAAQSQNLVS